MREKVRNACAVLLVISFLMPMPVMAAVTEEALKSVLVYRILQYVEWPKKVSEEEFHLAYIGNANDPQYQELRVGARQIRIADKPVKLLQFSPDAVDFGRIDAAFLAQDISSMAGLLADQGRRTNTLLVTDSSTDRRNFMINLYRAEDSTIKFEVNRSNIIFERLDLNRDALLLGGTELDIAEMFRESELELQEIKKDLIIKRQSLNTLEDELSQKDRQLRGKSSELQNKSKELQDKLLELKLKSDELQEKAVLIVEQQQTIDEKESHLGRLSVDLEKAAALLTTRQDDLKTSKERIDAKERELEQRAEILTQQTQKIEDNTSLIEQQEVLIAQQAQSLEQKESTIGLQRTFLLALAVAAVVFLFLILYTMKINRSRKQANEKLIAVYKDLELAKDVADEANAAKSRFLAKMSHEIRTPMSGVLGMSELLGDLNLNEEQKRCNDVIRSSGTVLLAIINDILDYSKIEAGKMEMESVPFELETLLADVVSMFRFRSRETGTLLVVDVNDDVPAGYIGDPTRIRQILINLISNAFKFTDKGQVTIHIKQVAENLELAVEDTGVGIPDDAKAQLFQAFTQAEASISRQYGGTGLGLSICQQLTDLMRGTIGVESEYGKGSTFWVKLPLPVADLEPAKCDLDLKGHRALLLEDNRAYGELFVRYAKAAGVHVDLVSCADEFHEILSEAANEKYDAIVCDLDLEHDNGVTVLEQVAESFNGYRALITASSEKPNLPVGPSENIQLIADKPFIRSDVKYLLTQIFLSQNELVVEAVRDHNKAQFPRANILIAEDNSVIRLVMKGLLQKLSLEAVFAEDGRQALDHYLAAQEPFDIVFMDCEMPVMDGLEATKKIRLYEQEHDIKPVPIVALTAHVLGDEVDKCYEAGMNALLNKPVKFALLKEKLQQYCGSKN